MCGKDAAVDIGMSIQCTVHCLVYCALEYQSIQCTARKVHYTELSLVAVNKDWQCSAVGERLANNRLAPNLSTLLHIIIFAGHRSVRCMFF